MTTLKCIKGGQSRGEQREVETRGELMEVERRVTNVSQQTLPVWSEPRKRAGSTLGARQLKALLSSLVVQTLGTTRTSDQYTGR